MWLTLGRLMTAAAVRAVTTLTRARRGVLEIDGVAAPYLEMGAGDPPLLFVHGFGGDKEGWLPLALFLRRRHRLVIVDLPGFGAASPVAAPQVALPAQAAFLAAALDRLSIDKAHLVGNSMGGGVSLRLASDAPERVSSLSLIGSMGPKPRPSEADEAIARGKNPLLPSSVDEADEFIRWVAEKPPPLPKPMRVFAIRRHIEARARLTSYFDVLHTEAGWTGLPEDWSAITAPALVIHGARDRVIDPATAEALTAQLPSAELRMLAGIGHVPQIEVPKLVAKLMEGFLP